MAEERRIDTTLIDKAIAFATEAHAGVPRKGKDIPYILHPMETAAIVASMTTESTVIAAAILHDTVEDNPDITLAVIEREFGSQVSKYVAAESEQKETDAKGSWKKRKSRTIAYLLQEDDENIKIIALGDKLSNIRTMHRDYVEVGDRLWARFNQSDKQEHGWYYKSLMEALSSLSQYPAYREYCALVHKVFD